MDIDRTQEEFDGYISELGNGDRCKYMTGIHDIMSLCNNILFKCKFRKDVKFHFKKNEMFECHRDSYLRLRKILQ